MVLSNKKLKQKLRSLVGESLAATESGGSHKDAAAATAAAGDVNEQLQSVRKLLSLKSQKPKLPNRPKRRKKTPLSDEPNPIDGIDDTQKEKSKKRKRDGDGDQESTEKEEEQQSKKKKDKEKLKRLKKLKKKRKERKEKEKEKKKAKDEKEENQIEKEDIVVNENGEKGVAESTKIDESEQDPKKIYVGGIPYYSTEDDIRSFFEGCGTVTEVDCMMFPETGKFRGIAMLTFKTDAAAKRALALDGADMGGFYLKIQPYKVTRAQKSDFAPEIVDGYNRIYIGNLSWDVTEDDLKKLFCECKVSSIRFGEDKETGEFKGYAHVDFSDSASLAVALKLDQNEVCRRPVKIRCAVPSKAVVKKAADSTTAGKPKKKKRLECYNCGVWGHLSSACTRKMTVEVDGSKAVKTNSSLKPAANKTDTSAGNIKNTVITNSSLKPAVNKPEDGTTTNVGNTTKNAVITNSSLKPAVNKAEIGTSAGNTKKKRRTCYECGVPGHLSSDCPRRHTVEVDGISGNS